MDLTDKLRHWGLAQSRARSAERDAAREPGPAAQALEREARQLRQQADQLHREIYGEIGRGRKPD